MEGTSAVEPRMRRAARSLRLLRFGELAAVWSGALAAAVLALGLLMRHDRLTRPSTVGAAFAILLLAASAALVALAVLAALAARPRFWLAHRLERVHPRLRDRLDTLVFLEPDRYAPEVRPYYLKIEEQAADVFAAEPTRFPFSRRPLAWRWAAALLLAAATAAFYVRDDPFAHVTHSAGDPAPREPPASPAVEEAAPRAGAEAGSADAPWGEVRITEPGRDVRVTRDDVLRLRIEAASSTALERALWTSVPPRGTKRTHALPAPDDPHYAAYQATLALGEYRLADWDVLSYAAAATTRDGSSYASDVYFVEVVPPREELVKLPGGEGGKAYALLDELSGLVDAQKEVTRGTHDASQERAKLAAAERSLAEAVRGLSARIAAEADSAPLAGVLDQLAEAASALDRAGRAVAGQEEDAPRRAQEALGRLASTRRTLHEAAADHPGALGSASGRSDAPQGVEERRRAGGVEAEADRSGRAERFRVEATSLGTGDDPRLRHVDAERLPAAWRDRIQRYLRRLSGTP